MAVHNSTVKWGVCENSTVAIGYSYYELNLFSQWTFILKVLLSHTWKKDKEGNDKPPNCLHKRLPVCSTGQCICSLGVYLLRVPYIWNTYYISICKFMGRFCVQSVWSSWQETYETALKYSGANSFSLSTSFSNQFTIQPNMVTAETPRSELLLEALK